MQFGAGGGCEFKWNLERQYFLNGLKDGAYEVRAKVFCSGYDSFATTEVKGSVTEENLNVNVDVSKPEPIDWRQRTITSQLITLSQLFALSSKPITWRTR